MIGVELFGPPKRQEKLLRCWRSRAERVRDPEDKLVRLRTVTIAITITTKASEMTISRTMAGDTSKVRMMQAEVREQIDSREFMMSQGTPKDVRHFPEDEHQIRGSNHLNVLASGKSPSRSIPINSTKERAIDTQYDQDAAFAEYREYMMSQRIASAKQKQLMQGSAAAPPSGARRVPAIDLQSMLLQNNNYAFVQGVVPTISSTAAMYDPSAALLTGLEVLEAADQDDDWGDGGGEEPIFELEL